ncbi:16S rRNA (guanine(527)-N(7))-methyltransferase RsmG [Spiroplasma culicicola]|uniref:Ribosomal RNA small subunit methyltransferase G n=1 Tax=Spiroplasma culicicola AES-1 TaxID=1276246 RepID=W6A917_9MOLU|nr:16S rRNA (guanine(527)-N(7))-methyltransferase RsmG [Spiroplasma culicicola]AHI53385.1 16S rRNA methyltransferase GidB [Spiroplasma culicicola AES-1]
MNWDIFEENITKITSLQKEQLLKYMKILQEQNKIHNLTRIIDDQEVFYKHFLDSLLFTQKIEITNQSIIDIGTGAGFPGIVLKIIYPDTTIYLIESNGKKINFLNLVIHELGLKNIYAVSARAEELSIEKKEQFDIVVSRAMAPLNVLLELGVQFLKVGGQFICLKSKNVVNEILELNNKESDIGLKLYVEQKLNIENVGERVNLFYKKINSTNNNYPRLYSQIKKKPLGK